MKERTFKRFGIRQLLVVDELIYTGWDMFRVVRIGDEHFKIYSDGTMDDFTGTITRSCPNITSRTDFEEWGCYPRDNHGNLPKQMDHDCKDVISTISSFYELEHRDVSPPMKVSHTIRQIKVFGDCTDECLKLLTNAGYTAYSHMAGYIDIVIY